MIAGLRPRAVCNSLRFARAVVDFVAELPTRAKDRPANGTSAIMSIGISGPMGGW